MIINSSRLSESLITHFQEFKNNVRKIQSIINSWVFLCFAIKSVVLVLPHQTTLCVWTSIWYSGGTWGQWQWASAFKKLALGKLWISWYNFLHYENWQSNANQETLAKSWSLKTFVHKNNFAFVEGSMTFYAWRLLCFLQNQVIRMECVQCITSTICVLNWQFN